VEMLPEVLSKMKKIPRGRLLSRLSEKGVEILTDARVTAIEEGRVCITKKDGASCMPSADTVIVAVAPTPENSLVEAMRGQIADVVAVGDAAHPGTIGSALRSATEVALGV
ncbi:MAG: hypothetical protein JRI36_09925, partial [Deltaproteobacteria bacterium]|nr:hypothetical protein [Deltaproteobacteria bacterium]